jgi:hypothetical protein
MQSPALWRLIIFVILAVHMQAGPLLEQGMRVGEVPLGMTWRMYSSVGSNVCAVQWFKADPMPGEDAPRLTPIDRLGILKVDRPWEAPGKVRHQYSPRDLQLAADKLCEKLPGVDLRASARCGIQRGLRWKHVLATDTPLCGRALPPAPRKGKP